MNKSITLAGQTNIAGLDMEYVLGKRTFLKHTYFITFITACLQVAWMSTMIWGTCHTVQSHAYALSNLHGVIIIPIMVIMRKNVHNYEKLGCLAILGASSLLILDRFSLRADSLQEIPGKSLFKYTPTFAIDLYVLMSNIPAFLFFSFNRSLLRKGFMKQVLLINFFTMCLFTMCAVLYEDAQMDMDPQKGLFGWLDGRHLFTCVFWYGFFATFFGSVGYILAMQFYSPLICMNAYLLEPFFAQILGCIFGIDLIPSGFTVLGTLVIFGASLMV